MTPNPLKRIVGVVTDHSRLTIAVMIVLTVVAGAGAPMIEGAPGQNLANNSTAQTKLDYINENYDTGRSNVTTTAVYVRENDGNVLSKSALLAALRYERRVTNNSSVASALVKRRGVTSVAGLVAARLAGDPAAGYDRRIDAVKSASEGEVEAAVRETLSADSDALALMPATYEPGTTSAESTRIIFRFRDSEGESASDASVPDAQEALYHRASSWSAERSPAFFVISGPATGDFTQRVIPDNLELIGPLALLLILLALWFAYRDIVDLVVGLVGVVLTLVWMFGLIGWMGVPFGPSGIVAPILLIGLSIDYGIHVFMRYREESMEAPAASIRSAMRRSLAGVAVALLLVTVTTALGFLANLTNSLSAIRQLAVATALGVVAALVVFVTIVPALKIEVEALLQYLGFDRKKQSLGAGGGRLTRFLTVGVRAARISAVGVLLVALLAGAGGAFAGTDLDRQTGTLPDEPADWKQEIPDPVGIEEYPLLERYHYVQDNYRGSGSDYSPAQILVEGEVTDPATLERIDEATAHLTDSEIAYRRGDGTVPVRTPLTVMEAVAERDETFASVYQAADTDDDGIPDENVKRVYDALFAAAPQEAARVIERVDGEYRSLRLVVPMQQSADERDVATTVREGANTIEADAGSLSATATGDDVIRNVQGNQLTENMFTTLAVSLLVILLLLVVIYRVTDNRGTLGVVTVLPVTLVVAWVLGGMWLFSVPLTLFTALMISLAIGLGVDYSIHVTERFAQEFDENTDIFAAMETAIVGTGGALLGSTATTVGAFATLSLATFPGLRQMGLMVGLALLLSFVASVFVLPSALALWARLVEVEAASVESAPAPATEGMD